MLFRSKKCLSPTWNDVFCFKLSNPNIESLTFECRDKDIVGSDFLGKKEIPLDDLIDRLEKVFTFDLEGVKHGKLTVGLKALGWSGELSGAGLFVAQPPPQYQFPSMVQDYLRASNPYAAVPFVAPLNANPQFCHEAPPAIPSLPGSGNSKRNVGESAFREGFHINYSEIKFSKKIGAGAFGEVWSAEWAGTKVAVKKILKADISEDDLAEFSQEILLMSKLRHPNIVQFLGATLDPEFCLLTEFMERGTLFNVLADNTVDLPWSRKIDICQDVAKGLLYLHTRTPPIIHRDVKSLNVLVTRDWKCTVADFGLTKIKDHGMLTTRCGSPAWSAPEVLRGEQYDEKADVFSYGIVVWETVTRQPPYAGLNPMQLIGQVAYNKPSLRPPIPPNCPCPELIDLMCQCWHDDPNVRPTFQQVLDFLKAIPQEGAPASPGNTR